MTNRTEKPDGQRAQKRQDIHRRIVDSGLTLFLRNGYEDTTIDRIAEAAGISRRSFFSYFGSKEDVLLARVGSGFPEALKLAMTEQTSGMTPLETARRCFVKLAPRYETEESAAVDRLLRSTPALRARKNALFVEIEQTLAEAMHKLWPDEGRHSELRVAAMAAAGALRLALDDRRMEDDRHPLEHYLNHHFALLTKLS